MGSTKPCLMECRVPEEIPLCHWCPYSMYHNRDIEEAVTKQRMENSLSKFHLTFNEEESNGKLFHKIR